jgi:pyrroline-5-carboxylate reductase
MHAVTATSGSGPAYAFLLAEAWIEGAIKQGLDPDVARELVIATLEGSAALLKKGLDPGSLRTEVTSKGGTTAAAIERLEKLGFRTAVHEALQAATERGRELDSEVSS